MSDDSIRTEHTMLVQSFASELRALKLDNGDPTLAALSARAHVSKAVLSDAFSGKKLPTEKTVGAISDALGADRDEWISKRNAVSYQLMTGRSGEHLVMNAAPARPARRPLVIVGLVSALGGALLTSGIWSASLILAGDDAEAVARSAEELIEPADGVDPMRTECREDAVIAGSEARFGGEVQVQMLYSKKCMAVWGRVTRYDGESSGNSIRMKIYPASDMNSARNQEREAYDVQSLYTTMLLEPDVEARVCGIAALTVDGETAELAPPVCV